jgi:hypothetical protein
MTSDNLTALMIHGRHQMTLIPNAGEAGGSGIANTHDDDSLYDESDISRDEKYIILGLVQGKQCARLIDEYSQHLLLVISG